MVQEVRNIILSLEEIRTAFVCYQRATPGFLPNQKIVKADTHEGNIITLTVEAIQNTAKLQQTVKYTGKDSLRPLIRFCIENNIMLPREGKKSVIFHDNTASIHIELDLNVDLPANVIPMHLSNLA